MASFEAKGRKKATETDVSLIPGCYCPNCQESHATTTMLPTQIPFFREIIVMSLSCSHCHFRNSEVTFGGEIKEHGTRLLLQVEKPLDLERQLVKSDTATIIIPSLELEIPPNTQRGTVTTLEGFLKRSASNLEALQPEKLRLGDLDNFYRCQSVIEQLRRYANGEGDRGTCWEEDSTRFTPFQMILDDPKGLSFIESFSAPNEDPQLKTTNYVRSPTQDMAVGLQPAAAAKQAGVIDDNNRHHKNLVNGSRTHKNHDVHIDETGPDKQPMEVMTFPGPCPNCQQSTQTNMCRINIPHFKEVILMSLLCSHCGYRSNEVKVGGAISPEGTRTSLLIQSEEDLKRELLLSDTASISIPEIDLEMQEGGMGGIYTTVEGLLKRLLEQLRAANPFATGDAVERNHYRGSDNAKGISKDQLHTKYREFLFRLEGISQARTVPATLVVDDPLSNSFIGPLEADYPSSTELLLDQGLAAKTYQRTLEQEQALGLSEMATENY